MNRTVGCFDPRINKSYSVSVCIMVTVESLISTCVKILEFPVIRSILFVPFCDCESAAPIQKWRRMVDLDLKLFLRFVL